MRSSLLHWGAALGIAVAFSSCAYDPYYASGSGYYGSSSYGGGGYGDGYGYGNSGFSTSLFVSTGDPRWGYDPYCYSYYDYNRRCYYDPYLYGYYPVGYRPTAIVGCPHPYGWRPGSGHCRPPSHIRNVTVVNYRNRESSYRNLNHSWAHNVRSDYGNRSNHGTYQNRPSNNRPADGWRNPGTAPFGENRNPSGPSNRGGFGNSNRGSQNSGFRPNNSNATLPPSYNQPVINRPPQGDRQNDYRKLDSRPPKQSGNLRSLGQSNPGYRPSSGGNSGFNSGHSNNPPPRIESPRRESGNNRSSEEKPSSSDGEKSGGGRRGGFR